MKSSKRNSKSVSKFDSFEARWGFATNLANASRQSTSAGIQYATSDLTDQILTSYQTCANESRTGWMSKLASESLEFLAGQRGVNLDYLRREAIYNLATNALVSQIFDLLRTYALEFNAAIGWNELYVTATKPSIVTEALRYNSYREPMETTTNARARFSTSNWSLVLRGTENVIEFLLMPAGKVIGLSKAEEAFEPVVSFVGVLEHGEVNWELNGSALYEGDIELICMELFTKLIEASKLEHHGVLTQIGTASTSA